MQVALKCSREKFRPSIYFLENREDVKKLQKAPVRFTKNSEPLEFFEKSKKYKKASKSSRKFEKKNLELLEFFF